MEEKIKIRLWDENDLEECTKLFNEVFGLNQSVAHSHWKYIENPSYSKMPVLSVLAEVGGRIVGMYPSVPYGMQCGDKAITAVQVVDNCVDPSFRHMGIQKAMYGYWAKLLTEKIDFAFGFPNAIALSVGTRLLKYTPVLISELFSCSAPYNKNISGESTLVFKIIDLFDSLTDNLWEAVRSPRCVAVVRSHQYLNWRFTTNPTYKFDRFAIYKAEQLVGYCVFRYSGLEAEKVAFIYELVTLPLVSLSLIIDGIKTLLISKGVREIFMWEQENTERAKNFIQSGFTIKKGNSRQLVYRPFSEPWITDKVLIDSSRWYISIGDSDF
jgi:hypothetical protein